jgi:predicted enzyme related to lactoylglutathione lyase
MTTDTAAAEAFYKDVVGWTAEPFAGTPMPYTVFKRKGDVGIGGMLQRPADMPMPPFWAMYIGVPNFENAAAHVKRLGGREISPVIDIPDVGRMQMMADPQGAAFYIMKPASPDRPEAPPELGDGSWHELMTTDLQGAMTFYRELFNWQPSEAMEMGDMGTYQMFNRGDAMLGGMMNKPKELADVPPNWGIYFLVPDLDTAVAKIQAKGGQILNGPMEVPGGDWVVTAMDPQGAAFSLHARKRS